MSETGMRQLETGLMVWFQGALMSEKFEGGSGEVHSDSLPACFVSLKRRWFGLVQKWGSYV